MCAVDQKRPFFLRAGPFLAFLPFRAYEKAGPLREAPYGEGRSLREGPGRGALRSQRRTTKRLTGRLSPYGKYGEGRSLREGPVLTERDGVPYGSLHKEGRRRGLRPLRERKIPYGEEPLRERKGLKARDTAYGKLGESFYQNWAGISAKKGSFFLGLGRFWPFCPLRRLTKRASPLREAPYGKGRSLREGKPPYRGPYGQTALREGPLRGGFLREGPLRITGKLTGMRRRPKTAVFS